MIDREHDLPITKQANVLKICRGSVYYLPRPVPSADLTIMRSFDRLNLSFLSPVPESVGCRGVQDRIDRRHVKTLMRRMRIEALYCRPRTTEPEPGHKISCSNPYGPSIYGGIGDTPTFLAGGQIGYNWQKNGWRFGVELDARGSVSDGTNTCLASSGFVVSAGHRPVALPAFDAAPRVLRGSAARLLRRASRASSASSEHNGLCLPS